MNGKGVSLFFLITNLLFSSLIFSQSTNAKKDSLVERGNDCFNYAYAKLVNTNLDSTIYYFDKATNYYKEAEHWTYYVSAHGSYTNVYYQYEDYEKAEEYAIKGVAAAKKYLNNKSATYSETLNNLSVIYSLKGNYYKSIATLEEILPILKQDTAAKLLLTHTYNNLANYLTRIGDQDRALKYSKIATELYLSQPKIEIELLAQYYASQAYIYENKDQLDSSNYYNYKIIDQLSQLPDSRENQKTLIQSYHVLVRNNLTVDDFITASQILNKIFLLQKEDNSYRKAYSYHLEGQIYIENDELEKAKKSVQKSLDLINRFSPDDFPGKAGKRLLLAEVYSKQGESQNALKEYQYALSTLSTEDLNTNTLENLTVEKYFALSIVLEILEEKANYLWTLYQEKNQIEYLNASLDTYENASQVIQRMRQGYLSPVAKNALSEKTIPVYEGAIKACYELYQKGEGEEYAIKAFNFAESNKAQLLLESLNEQTAKGFANIPDSLIQKEKDLRIDIAFYEKKILG